MGVVLVSKCENYMDQSLHTQNYMYKISILLNQAHVATQNNHSTENWLINLKSCHILVIMFEL